MKFTTLAALAIAAISMEGNALGASIKRNEKHVIEFQPAPIDIPESGVSHNILVGNNNSQNHLITRDDDDDDDDDDDADDDDNGSYGPPLSHKSNNTQAQIPAPQDANSASSKGGASISTGRTTVAQALPGAKVLSAGDCQRAGQFIPNQLSWQATGVLSSANDCSTIGVDIKTCYMVYMAPTGMLQGASCGSNRRRSENDRLVRRITDGEYDELDFEEDEELEKRSDIVVGGLEKRASARQRTEMLSWPPASVGEHWKYSWKSYLVPGVQTSGHFYHMTQVIAREDVEGPVITLDAKDGVVKIIDNLRGCDPCASVPVDHYTGRTLLHNLEVLYGSAGLFNYVIKDANTGASVLSYSVRGRMGGQGSVKFGTYRLYSDDLSASTTYYGDYSQTKL